jgi:hypothetical protein
MFFLLFSGSALPRNRVWIGWQVFGTIIRHAPKQKSLSVCPLMTCVIFPAFGALLVSPIRPAPTLQKTLFSTSAGAVHLPAVVLRAQVKYNAAISTLNRANRLNRLQHKVTNWTSAPVCVT